MSHSVIVGKRTRSQLTIPDDILKLPQRSPMKDARSMLKNQSMIRDTSSSNGTASDDELLLSPDKNRDQDDTTGGPRGVGQPSDQHTLGLPSPSQARASKRRKRDLQQVIQDPEPATEFGALASPPPTQDSRPSPGHRPPHELSPHKPTRSVSPPPSPAFLFPKDRARSVPPFMNTQIIPHIDLRDAPPSPTRSRSRSPSKERLRFVPGPFPSSKFNRIGESAETMDVDRPSLPVTTPSNPSTSSSTSLNDIPDIPPTPTTNRSSDMIVPFTPATSSSLDKVMPMSPLTPVPPTPMPSQSSIQSRIDDQASWRMGMPTLHEDEPSDSSAPTAPTTSATELSDKSVPTSSLAFVPPVSSLTNKPTLQSRVGNQPRLYPEKKTLTKPPGAAPDPLKTATQQSRTASMPPPTTIPSKSMQSQAKLKGYQQSTIASSIAGVASGSSQPMQKKNAFDVMMGKTRAPNSSAKAKEIGSTRVPAANKARLKMKPKTTKQNTTPEVLFVPEEPDESEKKERQSERFDPFPVKAGDKGKGKAEDQDQVDDQPVEEPVGEPESTAQPTNTNSTDDVMMDESPDNVVPSPFSLPADNSLETILPDTSAEEPPPSSSPPEPELEGKLLSSPTTGEEIPPQRPAESDSSPDHIPEADHMQTDEPAPIAGPSTSIGGPSNQLSDSLQPTTVSSKKVDRKPSLNSVRRVPSTGTLGRVTRSTSSRSAKEGVSQVTAPTAASRRRAVSTSVAVNKKPVAESSTNALKRTASGAVKKGLQESDGGEPSKAKPGATSTTKPSSVASKPTPVSPTKPTTSKPSAFPSSPIKPVVKPSTEAGPSNPTTKTPTKSRIPIKQHSTPSPTKITRTVPVISRPVLGLGRTFAVESLPTVSQPSSSLSTLSNALDRLRMPPPGVRPNTSMGFNHGTNEDEEGQGGTKDDSVIGKASSSKTPSGITGSISQRSVTLGNSSLKGPQQSADSNKKFLKQGTLSFMGGKPASGSGATAPTAIAGPSKTGPFNRGPFTKGKPVFSGVMIGAGPRRTVSKKSSLPVVVGSPVKGGGTGDGDVTMREQDEDDDMEVVKPSIPDEDIFMAPAPASTSTSVLTTATAEPGTDLVVPISDGSSSGSKDKGKGKERAESGGSRRVSMLSQSLSQSIFLSKADNHPPPDPPTTKGDMGPPPTPPSKRGNSSSPSAASSTRGGSSSPSGRSGPTPGVRSSSRLATRVVTEPTATTSRAASSTKKEKAKDKDKDGEKDPMAAILKDCKIFVDVRTDEGEDAGTLFSQMLETLGARLLTRVGSTCTHIVFKNGLSSTVSRYRAMDEPKPHVVGIAWVVDCVEQKRRSEEGPFVVDLTKVNVAGVHKRRRSVLPRLAAELTSSTFDGATDETADGNGDISMDGSQSSLALDDDLPPLERARRRRMGAGA